MYQIQWSNGQHFQGGQTVDCDSYNEALETVRREFPDAEIGHDGDLTEGGDRTLCWENEDESIDDGGQNAVASIINLDLCDACGGTVGACSCDYIDD